jgi:hypothetical protein
MSEPLKFFMRLGNHSEVLPKAQFLFLNQQFSFLVKKGFVSGFGEEGEMQMKSTGEGRFLWREYVILILLRFIGINPPSFE